MVYKLSDGEKQLYLREEKMKLYRNIFDVVFFKIIVVRGSVQYYYLFSV